MSLAHPTLPLELEDNSSTASGPATHDETLSTVEDDAPKVYKVGSKRKDRCIWTDELHSQFEGAVETLGIEHAKPMAILDIMQVPGLTKANVKSHLQKYRLKVLNTREGNLAALAGLAMLSSAGQNISFTQPVHESSDTDEQSEPPGGAPYHEARKAEWTAPPVGAAVAYPLPTMVPAAHAAFPLAGYVPPPPAPVVHVHNPMYPGHVATFLAPAPAPTASLPIWGNPAGTDGRTSLPSASGPALPGAGANARKWRVCILDKAPPRKRQNSTGPGSAAEAANAAAVAAAAAAVPPAVDTRAINETIKQHGISLSAQMDLQQELARQVSVQQGLQSQIEQLVARLEQPPPYVAADSAAAEAEHAAAQLQLQEQLQQMVQYQYEASSRGQAAADKLMLHLKKKQAATQAIFAQAGAPPSVPSPMATLPASIPSSMPTPVPCPTGTIPDGRFRCGHRFPTATERAMFASEKSSHPAGAIGKPLRPGMP